MYVQCIAQGKIFFVVLSRKIYIVVLSRKIESYWSFTTNWTKNFVKNFAPEQ